MTVSVAVLVTFPAVPVIVTVSGAVTAVVVTEKAALLSPAGTVRRLGLTVTAEALLESETTVASEKLGFVIVTVPDAELPPTTLAGLTATAEKPCGGGPTSPWAKLVPVSPSEPSRKSIRNNLRAEKDAPSKWGGHGVSNLQSSLQQ